jgi:hypothetical protein
MPMQRSGVAIQEGDHGAVAKARSPPHLRIVDFNHCYEGDQDGL